MRFWRMMRSQLFTADKPELNLAVLSPRSNSITERYINLTIQALRSITDRHVITTQYTDIDDAKFAALAHDANEIHFNALVAIGRKPTVQARRLYLERGIFIPTLIISHPDLVPAPLPKHMSGLVTTNMTPVIHDILSRCFPHLKKVIICADPEGLQKTDQIMSLRTQLESKNIQVVTINLNQSSHRIAELFEQHGPIASAVIIPNDSLAFQAMPELISLAHKYHCYVIAHEPYALTYNADLALGYPTQGIAHETAQHILSIIGQPCNRGFHPFQTTQEIHCRATSNIDWLNTLVTQESAYNVKIIGSTDSEQSGQGLSPTQTQSAKQ